MKITTTDNFPTVPAGSVMEKVGDIYVHESGFWLSEKVVESDPQRFPVKIDGSNE